MSWSDFVGGGDPHEYQNPYANTTNGSIYALENDQSGARAAQQSERVIGRRYNDTVEKLQTDPNFGRNAAVRSRLTNLAAEEADNATSDAYTRGAAQDVQSRARAGELSLQAGAEDFAVNQENERRRQSQTFGNSFVGSLIKGAVGGFAGTFGGYAASKLATSAFGGNGGNTDTGGTTATFPALPPTEYPKRMTFLDYLDRQNPGLEFIH